jgi:hypothetical protein
MLLLCGGQAARAHRTTDLYRVEDRVRKAFIGEQAVTAAILDVSNPDRKKIYFLVGHGELRPDDVDPARGLSMVRDQLRLRNYDVDTLDLAAARKVPADARSSSASPRRTRTRPSSRSCSASTWAPARKAHPVPRAGNAARPERPADRRLGRPRGRRRDLRPAPTT